MKQFFNKDTLRNFIESISPGGYIIKTPRSEDGIDGHIIAYVDRSAHIADQYRELRTDFYFLQPKNPLKTVIVTSSQPEEGKTVTACNLAVSISLDGGKKVALIDGDFLKPAVHKMFGISRKPGFMDLIDGNVEVKQFLEKPVIENVHVIPAGTYCENCSEKLDRNKITEIFNKLNKECDYVIIDTPPVLGSTISGILGSLCDGTLLVVKYGATQKKAIEEAVAFLEGARANLKATILTGHSSSLRSYGGKTIKR